MIFDSNKTGMRRIAVLLVFACAVVMGQTREELLNSFRNAPPEARPRVWWHWMSGNISKEGIKLDLEWMKRIGLGGFQNFDANLETPQIVDKRLVYMTPEWKDAFKYATSLADRLGLEMSIAASPGWTESGGPWVKPAQAMKKYVWSETRVEGGRPFTGALRQPPTTTGIYQNVPRARVGTEAEPSKAVFYADSAVVAYRASDIDVPFASLSPKITSSGGRFDLAALTDGDLVASTLLPAAPVGERSWIQFEFDQPKTFQAITFVPGNAAGREFGGGLSGSDQRAKTMELVAGDDGRNFKTVVAMPGSAATLAFTPVTAKYFRLTVLTRPPQANRAGFDPLRQGPVETRIAELVLHTTPQVSQFQAKAGFSTDSAPYKVGMPTAPASGVVRKADVIDLTGRMRADGTLDWTPPVGNWVVLRFGYTLTGMQNSPASPEATGLEVDKLSAAYVKSYFETYLDKFKDASGGLMGARGVRYLVTDSWEAAQANWTDNMMQEFARRRGYDMHPWMPVLSGTVVESEEASERFLWDFRKTIADLITENHYDQLTRILKARGLGRYTESHEGGRAYVVDGMDVKRNAQVPMSAIWTGHTGDFSADIRESASVAHIYGQNIVAAESLTSANKAFRFAPENLKATADVELANGLNRFVIHTSVHQPVTEKAPGLSLGRFGQWFTRLETWGEQAGPWITYLARSSYLLQQGRAVADILYYYGEDSNLTALFRNAPQGLPAGYEYDFASSDVLLNRVTAAGGRITTATGMSYRILALDPNSRHMTLAVLRKIRDLANAGVVVVGPKPMESPSLSDDQAEFHRIADQLWDNDKVRAGQTVAQAMTALKVMPDFEYTKPQPDTNLLYVHRKIAGGEIYWVNNRNARAEAVEATFRVTGKTPELWHADSGLIEPAAYKITEGRTTVPLRLDPNDAVFVVFRKPATAPTRSLPERVETLVTTIDGPWNVAFQPHRGAPASITMGKLSSWSDHSDSGVKYFSGTGTYTNTVQAPPAWFKSGAKMWLDLGDVKNVADVSVNGKPLGIVWKRPFRVDVTAVLRPGANNVEIKVTNRWVNRVIGDQQPGVTHKYTFTSMQFYDAQSPLLPSGLLGPVQLIREETHPLSR